MLAKVVIALTVGASLTLVNGKTALLIIDVQDCFLEAECTGTGQPGSLSVPACHVIDKVNAIRTEKACLFDEVLFSQDFHLTNHISYGSTHGLDPFSHLAGKGGLPLMCLDPASGLTSDGSCCPLFYIDPSMDCDAHLCPPAGWDYSVNNSDIIEGNTACTVCKDDPGSCFQMEQAMWTDHCLQSGDSGFPPSLMKTDADTVVQKGTNKYVDAYSAFMDNTQTLKTPLDDALQAKGITTLYIAGIATDVCVQWTVTDALGSNTGAYTVSVIKDATAAVMGNEENFNAAMGIMAAAGAKIITSEDVLAMQCPEMTCGDVKTAYKKSGCCGNPSKLIDV